MEERSRTVAWPNTLEIKPLDEASPPTDGSKAETEADSITFNILSFNVLAESYLTPRSHKNLPPASSEVVFNKELRRNLLKHTLEKLANSFDIICLQEVDDYLRKVIVESLTALGYSFVYAPRGGIPLTSSDVPLGRDIPSMSVQVDKRSDGCATFFSKSKWKCVNYSIVNFDDLADDDRLPLNEHASTLLDVSTPMVDSNSPKKKNKQKKQTALSGIIASYKRRNAALLLELDQIQSPSRARRVVVANAHLYWHPGYEYVKLSQAHYLLHKVKHFVAKSVEENKLRQGDDEVKDEKPTVIVCGDMNSKPHSVVHTYFTKGNVDARTVAPWNFHYNEVDEQEELALQMQAMTFTSDGGVKETDLDQDPVVGIDKDDSKKIANQDYNDNNIVIVAHRKESTETQTLVQSQTELPAYETLSGELNRVQPVKYLLDMTLNKFTRWLRILGQDAALETPEEEKLRTGDGDMILFERCRRERRNLVTTSKTLMKRKDCSPGAYLVNPSTQQALEETLVNLLLLHGITLYPEKFLTRCVVCNGLIIEVFDRSEQKRIFEDFASPDLGEDLDHVYKCDTCGQGYWWSSSPTSSASRVKDSCTHLLKVCLQGGVDVQGQPDFFAHVDYEAEKKLGKEILNAQSSEGHSQGGIVEVVGWLQDQKLSNPFDLKSVYAAHDHGNDEVLPFTNVTSDFVGALDYIFFEEEKLKQIGRLAIPTNFRTLNTDMIAQGHLLPSKDWPSDHLCIGSQFSLKTYQTKTETNIPSAFIPEGFEAHFSPQLGCGCGCVPNILSLFQMADLRKQARLKKSLENATTK